MQEEDVFTIFNRWEETGEFTREEAWLIRERLDEFLEREIGEVRENIERPEKAFTLFTRITSFLNAGIGRVPGIIARLEGWVRRLQDLLRDLARSLGGRQLQHRHKHARGRVLRPVVQRLIHSDYPKGLDRTLHLDQGTGEASVRCAGHGFQQPAISGDHGRGRGFRKSQEQGIVDDYARFQRHLRRAGLRSSVARGCRTGAVARRR